MLSKHARRQAAPKPCVNRALRAANCKPPALGPGAAVSRLCSREPRQVNSDFGHELEKPGLPDVLAIGHARALVARRPAPGPGSQAVPLVISRLSLRPPHREMAMDGRSLRLSDVLSTPLSTPELPTDCGDWLADRAPLSLACLESPEGSPLGEGRGEMF